MLSTESLDDLLRLLRARHEHRSFEYTDTAGSFRKAVREHFSGRSLYGVYVVYRQTPDDILYVGKAGTLDGSGRFKDQDLPGRLANVRGKVPAEEWFRDLVNQHGPIKIKYFVLDQRCSPALVEAALLQLYLDTRGRLPNGNHHL